MTQPNILEYAEPKKFLKDFVDRKKEELPSWSLGIWANKLGLSGTASISRLLDGKRIPGEQLISKLNEFFGFDAEQRKFFERLWARERFYRRSEISDTAALVIQNAKTVVLSGKLDIQKTSVYLAPLDLEPMVINDQVTASVNINTYPETSFGTFNESHVCIAVKPKNGGILDAGLFFCGHTYNSKKAIEIADRQWGYSVALGAIEMSDDQVSIKTLLNSKKDLFFNLSLKGRTFSKVDESYELFGYSKTQNGLFKAKFTIDSLGRTCEFKSRLDHLSLSANKPAAEILENLDFKPIKWVVHENLFSVVRHGSDSNSIGSY